MVCVARKMYLDERIPCPARCLGRTRVYSIPTFPIFLSCSSALIMNHFQLPFGIMILCLTIYGALARPRTLDVALTQTLHRDGIVFFLVR